MYINVYQRVFICWIGDVPSFMCQMREADQHLCWNHCGNQRMLNPWNPGASLKKLQPCPCPATKNRFHVNNPGDHWSLREHLNQKPSIFPWNRGVFHWRLPGYCGWDWRRGDPAFVIKKHKPRMAKNRWRTLVQMSSITRATRVD